VGLVVAAVAVTTVLVLLNLPIRQESSGYQLVGLRLYASESESIFGPPGWSNFTFRGATFDFQVYCEPNPSLPLPLGAICGSARESNGAPSSFTFFEPEVPRFYPPWQNWVAPDGTVAVEYHPGGPVHLLVAT